MALTLLERIKDVRDTIARREGVEPYFVLHTATLVAIARCRPTTLEDLAAIKGLGPKKIARYGQAILAAVNSATTSLPAPSPMAPTETVLTVLEYVGQLNTALAQHGSRIRGEISRIERRPQALYFELRDPGGEAVMACMVFTDRYELMGVNLAEGLEVILGGLPGIYSRTGRLNFRVETIELVGEGKLQHAYRALKQQLEAEGLLLPARKRAIPTFVQNIGLITSEHGAAIQDFTSNLERVGFSIHFADSRVEGARAIPELVAAMAWFQRHPVADVLVIIRGGGSWESLQAFNSEAVCRAIARSPVPVLVGIGHERDVPLAALVADHAVSTPSLSATYLSAPWRQAHQTVGEARRSLTEIISAGFADQPTVLKRAAAAATAALQQALTEDRHRLALTAERMQVSFANLWRVFPRLVLRVQTMLQKNVACASLARQWLHRQPLFFGSHLARANAATKRRLLVLSRHLAAASPARLLHLGYSLVRTEGRLVKSSAQLQPGDRVTLRFGQGGADADIERVE